MQYRFLLIAEMTCLLVSPALAEPPERRITWPEKPVPVSMNLDKGWYVDAQINGKPVKLAVGTQTDFTHVFKHAAVRLGLKPLAGYEEAALIPKLSVAGAELENEPCILTEIKSEMEIADGVIGHSTLREFAVRLNFPDGKLSLMKPDALAAPAGDEGVVEMDIRESEVSFTGTKVSARRGGVSLLVSTEGGVILPMTLAGNLDGRPTLPEALLQKKLPSLLPPEGGFVKPVLRLGSISLQGIEYLITTTGTPGHPDDAGILSRAVLIGLDLTLDYTGRRARARMGGSRATWEIEGSGLTLGPLDGGWQIVDITTPSPASRAGLQKADLLSTIGGKSATGASAAGIASLVKAAETNEMTFLRRVPGKDSLELALTVTPSDSWPDDPLIRGHLRDWTFPDETTALEIPLEVSYGMLLARVKVNGHSFRCIVDTGASCSFLSVNAAGQAGLKALRKLDAATATLDKLRATQGVADTVELGSLIFRREPWGIATLPEWAVKYDGFLGLGTLRDFVIRFDWKAKTLTLWKRGTEPAVNGGVSLMITVTENFIPASSALRRFRPVACQINLPVSGQEFPFLIDTGFNDLLALPEKLFEEKLPALAATAGPRAFGGRGFAGTIVAREVILPHFTFAGETLKDLKVDLFPRPNAILGAGILRHFAVTLDVDGGKMHMQSHGTLKEITAGSTSGMLLDLRDGQFVIAKVVPDGPADAAGIKEGDIFESIEGRAVKGMSEEEFTSFRKSPPGTVLKLMIRRGNTPLEVTVIMGKR